MRIRSLAAVAAMAGFAACLNTGDYGGEGASCDDEYLCGTMLKCVDGTCVDLANPADGGPGSDAGGRDTSRNDMPDLTVNTDIHIEPCSSACSGETPACDTDTGTCVPCLGDDDCGDDVCLEGDSTADSACVACRVDEDCAGGVCDTESNTCVACLEDADCTEVDAARCEVDSEDSANNFCTACDDSSQCAGTTGTEICGDDGSCVECTDENVDTRAACGNNSCDPATNTCTETPLASLAACEACVADSECPADHRCVPMDFAGQFHGTYCLKRLAAGCEPPFSEALEASSASGAPVEQYCSLKAGLTTCEASQSFLNSCSGNNECGAPNLMDGRCEEVDTIAGTECTYSCEGINDCEGTAECTGGSDGDKWCQ